MENYFQEVIDRKNTDSVKWDGNEMVFGTNDLLPMWVADMDFAAPPELKKALMKRAEHNIYGYPIYGDPLVESIQKWLKTRHNTEFDPSLLSLSPGVIPSLHAMVQAFTEKGDQIVIQPPVYPPFFNVITAHKRTIVENPLIQRGEQFKINFEELEELFQNGAKAFLLCSPHNPVGRVWTEEEIKRITDLCLQYDVLLFSDEIHADLVLEDHVHHPALKVADEARKLIFTLMAPSKTFNIAGLQASYVISPNQEMKEKLDAQFAKQGINMINTFAYIAMQTVYEYGESWLDQLLSTIEANRDLVLEQFQASGLPIYPVKSEGTYLMWVDFRETGLSHEEIKEKLIHEAKVGLNDGVIYGKQGEGFMRINIGAPSSVVKQGVSQIIEAFKE